MKTFFLLLGLSISTSVLACPACNIHNYLAANVHSASLIYSAELISLKGDNYEFQVLSFIKNTDNDTIEATFTKSLTYKDLKIGDRMLFLKFNKHIYGPSYYRLPGTYEDEVRFLADTNRSVRSVDSAIWLLNCVSRESNRLGADFIRENYENALPALKSSIVNLRQLIQQGKEPDFAAYRMENMISALTDGPEHSYRDFLFSEIDSVANSEVKGLDIDAIHRVVEPPLGEYLRDILSSQYTKQDRKLRGHGSHQKVEYIEKEQSSFYIDLKTAMLTKVNTGSPSTVGFFTYALGFSSCDDIKEIEILSERKYQAALGLLFAADWNDFYFQRGKIEPLIDAALEIYVDDAFKEYADLKKE